MLLDQPEVFPWPATRSSERARVDAESELVALYPRRSDVPSDLWPAFFDRAEREIGLLAYAALFLVEQYATFVERLAAKAAQGCRVRIALGDPESEAVRARGEEERFGEGIESRARMAFRHYEPLLGLDGVEIRLHGTTLYNSIYRSDDEVLVNLHILGANAYGAPVMHVRRIQPGALFDAYAASFEAVWQLATPPRA